MLSSWLFKDIPCDRNEVGKKVEFVMSGSNVILPVFNLSLRITCYKKNNYKHYNFFFTAWFKNVKTF